VGADHQDGFGWRVRSHGDREGDQGGVVDGRRGGRGLPHPGTPYEDSYGRQDSPDCGYTYTRQGVYQVWARSYWSVQWSGLGQSGSIPLQFANSVRITVGEAQVLTQ